LSALRLYPALNVLRRERPVLLAHGGGAPCALIKGPRP
jgi:hypothetical protein